MDSPSNKLILVPTLLAIANPDLIVGNGLIRQPLVVLVKHKLSSLLTCLKHVAGTCQYC